MSKNPVSISRLHTAGCRYVAVVKNGRITVMCEKHGNRIHSSRVINGKLPIGFFSTVDASAASHVARFIPLSQQVPLYQP